MSLDTKKVTLTKNAFKAKLKLELALIGIGMTNKLLDSCIRVGKSRLKARCADGIVKRTTIPMWHRIHIDVVYTDAQKLALSSINEEFLHYTIAVLDKTLADFLLSCTKSTSIRFLNLKLQVTGDKKIKWEEL